MLLVQNGELYDPGPRGRVSVLVAGGRVLKAGDIDRKALDALKVEYEVIDAAGKVIVPGLIDPHEHLLGGSGEGGFGAQTPESRAGEILLGGVTTVVGTLGVDTTMKYMPGLIGRAKALNAAGLTALAWAGAYDVPPRALTSSIRNDILLVEEVIGVGEVAIADERSLDPSPHELARLASEAFIGGHLAKKAGLTHFHVGPGEKRLSLLRHLLDEFDVKAEWLYPTHVERSEKLMREAVALAKLGAAVDVDVVEKDLPRWLRYYRSHGGLPDRLTASTDASLSAPRDLLGQVRACVEAGSSWPTCCRTSRPTRRGF